MFYLPVFTHQNPQKICPLKPARFVKLPSLLLCGPQGGLKRFPLFFGVGSPKKIVDIWRSFLKKCKTLHCTVPSPLSVGFFEKFPTQIHGQKASNQPHTETCESSCSSHDIPGAVGRFWNESMTSQVGNYPKPPNNDGSVYSWVYLQYWFPFIWGDLPVNHDYGRFRVTNLKMLQDNCGGVGSLVATRYKKLCVCRF